MSQSFPLLSLLLIVGLALYFYSLLGKTTVFEFQRGLLFTRGKFVKMLAAGRYRYLRSISQIVVLDVRRKYFTIPGQEVLTKDNVNIKISLTGFYEITDVYKAYTKSESYQSELYDMAQIALRNLVAGYEIDALLEAREKIGELLLSQIGGKLDALGLKVEIIGIRDIMLPGALKSAYAGAVEAKKDALKQLEKARGEQAVLRSLANSAKMLEENPGLLSLRMLQAISNSSGNTVVFGSGGEPVLAAKK